MQLKTPYTASSDIPFISTSNMEIIINNKLYATVCGHLTESELKEYIHEQFCLNSEEYYLLFNGKRIKKQNIITNGVLHIVPRVIGGKGGFGSMLRAIGAQIEKTTNREACRDLSGRRLRDINEEQRLKNWINQQADREKEAKERKKKKLERLCQKPKHEFTDAEYDKERSELPEKVEDALLQGLQASCSTKRKIVEKKETVLKKKAKLWVDDELDEDLSSSSSGDENEGLLEQTQQPHKNIKNAESDNSSSVDDSSPSDIKTDGKMNPISEKVPNDTNTEKETTEDMFPQKQTNLDDQRTEIEDK